MKILNITHTDADGLGAELVLKHLFGADNVDVERCNYNSVNSVLYSVYKERVEEYDKIYITDISISDTMANWTNNSFGDKVVLIDHHPTAVHLNKYDWANVTTHDSKGKTVCASKLVAKHFNVDNPVILEVVSHINDYDCWHWATNGNTTAKDLNDLFYTIGFDKMVEEILHQSETEDKFTIQDKYKFLLEIRKQEYEHYLEASNKSLSVVKYKGYNVGVVFAERFVSELGNDLAKLHPELDFIALPNMRSGLSLRGIKEDIDLGLIAKEIGEGLSLKGGGHPRASSVTMTLDYKLNMFSNIFEITKKEE